MSRASSSLQSLLSSQAAVITDGALGTELERRGITISSGKLWSAQLLITDPGVLADIHADYYAAGADICATATYQASMQGFAGEGVDGLQRLC